jgi:hypothetical protein
MSLQDDFDYDALLKESLLPVKTPGRQELSPINSLLRIEPSEIIFRGFDVGTQQTRVLKITNTAAIAQRLHIIPPLNQELEFCFSKKASIAPGMSQSVTVKFVSKSLKSVEAVLKIQSPIGWVGVPVKAFPSLTVGSEELFPKKIAFHAKEINQRHEYVKRIESSIDVPFEFELTKIGECDGIEVGPYSGTIPANGFIDIKVAFKPMDERKYECKARVR